MLTLAKLRQYSRCFKYLTLFNFNTMHQEVKKAHKYAFVIDIDGTLIKSNKVIENSQSIESLNWLSHNGIPFVLLSNNIAKCEQTKANELNGLLDLESPLTGKDIILSYTPLKKEAKWKEKVVLVVGRDARLHQILPLEGMPLYVTVQQMCAIFPEIVPLSKRKINETSLGIKAVVEKRLNMSLDSRHDLVFGAVFIITCPLHWEECYQVIIDLLSSETGTISTDVQYQHVQNHIPVIATFNDMFALTNENNLPRLLMKPFNEGLKAVYRSVYATDLNIQTYGKPELKTYSYTRFHMEALYGKIDKMVMIGDNIETDIVGAYEAGWDSILVKTGVAAKNSELATVNAVNIWEGIHQYLKRG